jgi:hypothetical protein
MPMATDPQGPAPHVARCSNILTFGIMTGRCIDPSGYDAGKKIRGKKRHILVDTVGLLLHAVVHPIPERRISGSKR